MTTDNQKKYEEAARRHSKHFSSEHKSFAIEDFLAGASFAEKEGFNAGIQKATDFINHTIRPYSCDQADFLAKEIEKLKL